MADGGGRKSFAHREEEQDIFAAENEFQEMDRMLSNQGHRRPSASSAASSAHETDTDTGDTRKRKGRSPEDKTHRRIKTKRSEEGNEEDIDEVLDKEGDPLANLLQLLEAMRGWWKQPAIMKLVTKPQTEKFARYMEKYQEEVIRAREERARLETRVEERKQLVDIVRQEVVKVASEKKEEPGRTGYAAAVARNVPKVPRVTGAKGPVLPAPKMVIVKHESKESEEVCTTLKRLIKPKEIGLKVRRLIKIRNGVIVEAESDEGAENLLKQKSLTDAGLKVEKPTKKRPVIMIYDVDASLTDEDIRDEVYNRNLQGSGVDRNEFVQEFEIRHKYRDTRSSGKKNHLVVECSVRVRNWLRRQEKIFVEWQCCRVKDYVDVARCYKCQRFGHVAKHCTAAKASCSHCAGEHDFKECPNKKKKEAVCCANCKRDGRTDKKHDAGSRLCPAYDKAVKRQNEKIDYGS